MGDRSRYTIELSDEEVANYWQFIGMTKRAWQSMSKTRQAQLAWEDMYEKQRLAQEALEKAKRERDS